MTFDEPPILSKYVRAAIEAVTVLSNPVNDIGKREAVAAAHRLRASEPGPPASVARSSRG